MTRFFALVVLAAAVASSGCRTMGRGGCCDSGCGEPCHVTRSNMAPRPEIMRDACMPGYGCGSGGCCLGGDNCGGNCGGGCGYGGCCDTCGGSGCALCDSGCCNGPEWCGLCHRQCGCYGDCGCGPAGGCGPSGCCGGGGGVGGRGQYGMVNGAVSRVLDGNYKDNVYNFNPGPPAAQVAYPYYTVRGPRDFLASNPAPIGPY